MRGKNQNPKMFLQMWHYLKKKKMLKTVLFKDPHALSIVKRRL